jgi:hypothetical protein
VNLIEVYWLPASEWWISSLATTGRPSWSRCQIAIRNGVITRSVAFEVEACQATIRCANTSTMNAT